MCAITSYFPFLFVLVLDCLTPQSRLPALYLTLLHVILDHNSTFLLSLISWRLFWECQLRSVWNHVGYNIFQRWHFCTVQLHCPPVKFTPPVRASQIILCSGSSVFIIYSKCNCYYHWNTLYPTWIHHDHSCCSSLRWKQQTSPFKPMEWVFDTQKIDFWVEYFT